MTRKSSSTATPLPSSSKRPAENAFDASRPGPGTSVAEAMASQKPSAQITRLVATTAPRGAATSTSPHGFFSLGSSRPTTNRPKAGGGRQASAQTAATSGP